MNKRKNCNTTGARLGTVGGQAVLEGVMMKSRETVALSVRDVRGNIVTEVKNYRSARDKNKYLNIPILRGVINFAEMMVLSFQTLTRSADMLGIEEEESRFEKWLTKTFGKSIAVIASLFGAVLGVGLSVLLFLYLPTVVSDLAVGKEYKITIIKSLIEGAVKMLLFIAYLALVGLIPDMKRTFQYHGAEHKSIFCHESETELTVENVKRFSRFHPRCGTSFLVVMMVIGVFVSVFFINLPRPLRVLAKILTLPAVVGLGYEFIRYAGTHHNLFVRILSAPGLWIQNLTTKEPDGSQIEVAIKSLMAALPAIYPDSQQPPLSQMPEPGQESPPENVSQTPESRHELPPENVSQVPESGHESPPENVSQVPEPGQESPPENVSQTPESRARIAGRRGGRTTNP